MNLFKKMLAYWSEFRHWWNHRGHAKVGDTIFLDDTTYGGLYYDVIDQHTHTCDGPPEILQVIRPIELPGAEQAYVFKSQYQTLADPCPPFGLSGINRVLYALYHFLFANQLYPRTLHLHFDRTNCRTNSTISHEEFAPHPSAQRIIYWRPRMGRWFLHTGWTHEIEYDLFSSTSNDCLYVERCRVVLQNGNRVDIHNVLGELSRVPRSLHCYEDTNIEDTSILDLLT